MQSQKTPCLAGLKLPFLFNFFKFIYLQHHLIHKITVVKMWVEQEQFHEVNKFLLNVSEFGSTLRLLFLSLVAYKLVYEIFLLLNAETNFLSYQLEIQCNCFLFRPTVLSSLSSITAMRSCNRFSSSWPFSLNKRNMSERWEWMFSAKKKLLSWAHRLVRLMHKSDLWSILEIHRGL